MKQFITLIAIILLIVLGRKGYRLFKKYRHSKHLKLGINSFRFPKLDLSNITEPITVLVKQGINNFSPSSFEVESINIDVFSPTGKLVAEQKEPLTTPVNIRANQLNEVPLKFDISPQNILKLIKDAGGALKVGANYLTSGEYGIPLHLKGFVRAEGFDIDIDEKITV